ncbi:unnamed protein product [Parnassius apollo]|uniref:(apollo) hypothetical protein n=1 Tax=Parnassius apollo TaxID=110799 RepID=A0A8S3WZC2_PARAO|nr:unnamed protein product [Parnassius apollo]
MHNKLGVNAAQFNQDVTNRIVNGNIASELQFPYMVSLQQLGNAQSSDTRGHRCGGVLVTLQHALTAASCLFDVVSGNATVIKPDEYRIFAGSSLLTNDTSADRIRNIANFTIHPEYTGSPGYVNNIAIITFTAPYSNAVVQPLSLPASDFQPADFTLCTMAGWGGANASASASTTLRYANKYIYNQHLCSLLYNIDPISLNILPSMVCAASYDTISSGCERDVGNPLVCNNILTGVLFGTHQCQISSYPELYTRVSTYSDWINSVSSAPNIFSSGTVLLFMIVVTFLFTVNND